MLMLTKLMRGVTLEKYLRRVPPPCLAIYGHQPFHNGKNSSKWVHSISRFKQNKQFTRYCRNSKEPITLVGKDNVNPKVYMRDTIGTIYKILKYSTWDSAQEQLEELPVRWDSYTINQVLKTHPPMEKAWLFFNWAYQLKGFKHDQFTYTTMLDIFGEAGRISSMNYVFQQMQEKGIQVDTVTYTSLMHWLSKAGNFDGAMKAWEEMKVKGCHPTVVSYTTYMKILLDNNRVNKAADVYKEMIKVGCSPNCRTYTVLMEYLVRCCKYEEALEIFSKMQESGEQPDKAACNILVEKCCEAGETHTITQILQYMRDNHLVLRYSVFLKALETLRSSGETEILLRQVNPHISSDSIGKQGAVESTTTSTDVPLTVDRALLLTLVNKQNVVAIDHVLAAMINKNVQLDSAIVSTIIELNCGHFRPNSALKAFEYSVKMGMRIGKAAYLALVGVLIRSNSLEKIVEIIEEMVRAGHPLGTYASALLIYRLGCARRPTCASKIFKLLLDDEKNSATYTALISAYFFIGSLDKGLKIYETMKKEGVHPTSGTYNVILSGLEKSGRIKEAEILRKEKKILQADDHLQYSVPLDEKICDLLFSGDTVS